jgi:hypothetical protein
MEKWEEWLHLMFPDPIWDREEQLIVLDEIALAELEDMEYENT